MSRGLFNPNGVVALRIRIFTVVKHRHSWCTIVASTSSARRLGEKVLSLYIDSDFPLRDRNPSGLRAAADNTVEYPIVELVDFINRGDSSNAKSDFLHSASRSI